MIKIQPVNYGRGAPVSSVPDSGLPPKLDKGRNVPPYATESSDQANSAVFNTDLLAAATDGSASQFSDLRGDRPLDPKTFGPQDDSRALGPSSTSPLDSMPVQPIAGQRLVMGLPVTAVMPSSPPRQAGN